MKNASPAPISNPPTARCQILRSPDSESSPRTSRTAARMRSAASMTSRWGNRSAATPPISTNASRPTLNRAVTSESSVGPPSSSITCHASATSHSPLPTSEIASPVHSRRKSRWRRGRNAVGTPPSTVTTVPSRTASPVLSACPPLYSIRPSSSDRVSFLPSLVIHAEQFQGSRHVFRALDPVARSRPAVRKRWMRDRPTGADQLVPDLSGEPEVGVAVVVYVAYLRPSCLGISVPVAGDADPTRTVFVPLLEDSIPSQELALSAPTVHRSSVSSSLCSTPILLAGCKQVRTPCLISASCIRL